MPTKAVIETLVQKAARDAAELAELKAKRERDLSDLADAIVRLRTQFEVETGKLDWKGISDGYRGAVQRIFDEAGLQPWEVREIMTIINKRVRDLISGLHEIGVADDVPNEDDMTEFEDDIAV